MDAILQSKYEAWYDFARKWFTTVLWLISPVLFFLDAPFGRFSPARDSIFLVDGIKSFILMELVSPLTFTYALVSSPLSISPPPLSLTHPATLLSALYLIHYLNRSLISPLRTPSRSKSHIIVPLFAVAFNIINGSLMGTYLSSPPARAFLATAYARPSFYVGLAMWASGFAGNIIHDEILLDIRRKAQARKAATEHHGKTAGSTEHYAIPYGLLYKYISYPNYFCEWIEWTGFAMAAAPVPKLSSPLSSLFSSSASPLSPPYIFLLAEVLVMLPRAWRGHEWYRARFPQYPPGRKAVIPFVF